MSNTKSNSINIIKTLTEVFFDEDDYNTSIKGGTFFIYNKSEEPCLSFSVHMKKNSPPEIIIDTLKNCTSLTTINNKIGTGSHTIKLLVELTRQLRKYQGFEQTELIVKIDTSRLFIHEKVLYLSVLYILTKGKSWYNSLGFYEENYKENYKKALKYILQPIKGKKNETIQSYYTYIFTRIKKLSEIIFLNDEQTKELNKYAELLDNQSKSIKYLFKESDKFTDLKYRF